MYRRCETGRWATPFLCSQKDLVIYLNLTCSHIKFKSKETCSVGTLRVRVIEIETETFGVCTVGVGICNCRRDSRLVVKFHVRDASAEALSPLCGSSARAN